VLETWSSTELPLVTVNEPVTFEFPCEKKPFLITNSLGILYLFPIQD
jgi:hypothetical protein